MAGSMLRFGFLVVPVLAASLHAQHAIVATRSATMPVAALLDVDLAARTVTQLPRFPSDSLAPRAITIDSVNRDLILALDNGATTSRLVRVHRQGAAILGERVLGDIQGVVTAIATGLSGDLFVTAGGTSGALLRMPRNGGTAVQVASLPRSTALTTFGHHSSHAYVGQSGAAGADPMLRIVDLSTGATTLG